MRINIKEALIIAEKYDLEEIPIIYMSDIYVKSLTSIVSITRGSLFNPSQYELLSKANINEIEVIFSEKLYAKLAANYPSIYRFPTGRKNVIELDRLIDEIETANSVCKRKRCIISLSEIYKKTSTGYYEPILKFNEKLTYKRWNEIKININRNTIIDFRYDEIGIIVFFILTASDPFYPQKFIRFTELISIIVESSKSGVSFSANFLPENDIYTVNTKDDLLRNYIDTKAALIIVGEDINDDYKYSLSQVKAYDRFSRMMVIKNPDPTRRIDVLNQIKRVYSKNLWEEQ